MLKTFDEMHPVFSLPAVSLLQPTHPLLHKNSTRLGTPGTSQQNTGGRLAGYCCYSSYAVTALLELLELPSDHADEGGVNPRVRPYCRPSTSEPALGGIRTCRSGRP